MVVNLFFFVDLFLLKGFNLSFKIIAHAFISMIKFIHFFLVILRTFYHLSYAHLSFLRMLLLNFLLFFLLFLNVVHFLSHKFIHFFRLWGPIKFLRCEILLRKLRILLLSQNPENTPQHLKIIITRFP